MFEDIWDFLTDLFYYDWELLVFIAIAIVVLAAIAVIHGLVARNISKNRGMEGGFWWGFCLLGLGLLVVAFRPNDALIAKAIAAIAPPAPVEASLAPVDAPAAPVGAPFAPVGMPANQPADNPYYNGSVPYMQDFTGGAGTH